MDTSIVSQPNDKKKPKTFILHNEYFIFDIITISVNELNSLKNINYMDRTLYDEDYRSKSVNTYVSDDGLNYLSLYIIYSGY